MLKGERCNTPKCSLERRAISPKRRSNRRFKISDYGLRVREKQKARHSYGVLERQFRLLFAKAKRAPGMTGENLVQLLEIRLDNVIYRLGFADSRRQARQLVQHGHVIINDHKVDIPSYQVKPQDVISWGKGSISTDLYQKAVQEIDSKVIPSWLSLDKQNLSGRVLTLPSEIEVNFDKKLIVEYYSR
jgi:small subunit ribosomal protein S4